MPAGCRAFVGADRLSGAGVGPGAGSTLVPGSAPPRHRYMCSLLLSAHLPNPACQATQSSDLLYYLRHPPPLTPSPTNCLADLLGHQQNTCVTTRELQWCGFKSRCVAHKKKTQNPEPMSRGLCWCRNGCTPPTRAPLIQQQQHSGSFMLDSWARNAGKVSKSRCRQ